jgi:acetyl-CoA carboxylase biotin carboxylase subunit
MFERVLVANRGEIACRVMRTCRVLGVETIAVYSDADAHALHVELADTAVGIGPAPAPQSYLNVDAVLDAARRSGADAVHPGYGFLAESAAFAARVADAGLTFIGPTPEAMAAMGDKVRARTIAREAGVPVVAGSGALVDEDDAASCGREIGYPVLVKVAAGGGGIGMGVARDEPSLRKAFGAARTRGERFFGNPAVFLERYLERPRHVEIQVLADEHGNAMHLYDRECSVQRRHQKVIEESPSPAMTQDLLNTMADAALALVERIGYTNAGTVEFLVADEEFSFLEMNTRLQVEHTVTEQTTGLDLVELQLRAAAGEPLRRSVQRAGHAIELRVYAEDPRTFLPSPGRLDVFEPPSGDGIRVDSGVRQGDEVTVHYDPLLAKVVVTAPTRADAIERALDAVRAFRIDGIRHNLPLHERVLQDPAFRSGRYDTGILEEVTSEAR